MSLLTLSSENKNYNLINVHAPLKKDNKVKPYKVEEYWKLLENEIHKIRNDDIKVLLEDFNALIEKEKVYRKFVGNIPAHKKTNKNGIRPI